MTTTLITISVITAFLNLSVVGLLVYSIVRKK